MYVSSLESSAVDKNNNEIEPKFVMSSNLANRI